jgi:hypothetical protein
MARPSLDITAAWAHCRKDDEFMNISWDTLAANRKTWEQALEWAFRSQSKTIARVCSELSDKAWARHRAKLDAWLAGDPLRGVFYEFIVRALERHRQKH